MADNGNEHGTIDFDQVRVERLVSDLRNDIAELATYRLAEVAAGTHSYVAAEEENLGGALTALQMLLSHIAADGRPLLRVVR